MSAQIELPGLFEPAGQPATQKQIAFAKSLATRAGVTLPSSALRNRDALSAWIEQHHAKPQGKFAHYPSAKQVQFAERIARLKRREIPDACFKDRTLMSRWIDGNKPR